MSKKLKCQSCGNELGVYKFQPIQTYECHIEITFWEHVTMEGGKRKVPMCRACALREATEHIKRASAEKWEFFV